MSNDLTNLKIKNTYQNVVQYRSASFYDLVGNEIVNLNASLRSNYKVVSSSYSILTSNSTIEVVEAFVTQSLPTAVGNGGLEYSIINTSTGSVRIEAFGSEIINNENINDTYMVIFQGDAPRIVSNNTNWRLI